MRLVARAFHTDLTLVPAFKSAKQHLNMKPPSHEEILASGIMDPALKAELALRPIRSPQPSDPYYEIRHTFHGHRAHRATRLRELHHLRYIPAAIPEQVHEEDREIPMRNGNQRIRVRVYTPTLANPAPESASVNDAERTIGGRPLIVMYHEGGWSMGDLSDEEVNCRMFARDLGAVCVNVEYRLAPEHRFPTGINDSWEALKWAAKNATLLGANPFAGFIVGGGSAGGNIAAVLAHMARDEKLSPPLTGQYLCVPAIMCLTDPDRLAPKYRERYLSHPKFTPSIDPILQVTAEETGNLAAMIGADTHDPRFVPFLYGEKEEGHRHLPPAYFQTCGLDPLRDESLIYADVLEESGVEAKVDLYSGFGHYFWTNWPRLDASRRFVEDTREGVRWLLSRSSGDIQPA